MFNTMKKMALVMAAMMSMGTAANAAPIVRVSVGPAPVQVVRPAMPGMGYVWVDAGWVINAHGVRVRRAGYWRAPRRVVVHRPVVVHRQARTTTRRVVHTSRRGRR